jgi:hydroxymethylbilane synthase
MTTSPVIRIGTRESALALYQAREVQKKINALGISTEIVEITSDGDIDLTTPLYEMGIQGIFTKSLDIALLQNRIDIAVHSTKDVPTKQAKGLVLSAVLERATPFDCLVLPQGKTSIDYSAQGSIATSSLRRKLQWLNRYPHHQCENLRGNVQTRLKKLDESNWLGAIFAQAALQRLDITSHQSVTLDWMLPSPAQGAVGMICRKDDAFAMEVCEKINHVITNVCITAERDFLAALHGGCAVPIAAHATIQNNHLRFRGNVMSLDAKQKCEVEMEFSMDQTPQAGQLAAKEIIARGAEGIIKTFRSV